MNDLPKKIVRFLLDEQGPTTVEYAMLVLLVFLAVLTAITAVGQATATSLQASGNSIEQAFGLGR
jgi:pilus assembly protein Flp/PilA